MTTGVIQEFSAQKEYVKNGDITPEDVRKLRSWLDTQPHLPGKYLTDLDLVLVYHCCDHSAEVSKQVLDLHFTLRTVFTSFFKNRDFDKAVESCLDTTLYVPLATPTVHGYRAIYCRLLDYDPRNFLFNDCVRTFMMTFDLWQREEGTWPGFVLIIDFEKAALGHLARVDVMSIRQVLYFLQEAMLVKLKEVHFMNAPYFMDKVMMLLKPFMKKSLLDMVHIHQVGSDTMDKFVPKEALPKDSGGQYKGFNTIKEESIERMRNNRQYFKEENRKRVAESLRPGGATTTVESLFGIQGSFKKLDID